MFRTKWYSILIVETILISALIFAKFWPAGSLDFYYMMNGQTYRYFIYTIVYMSCFSLLVYNPLSTYVYLRIQSSFIRKYVCNLMLPILVNLIATLFAVIYGSVWFRINMSSWEVGYSLLALVNYQLFIALVYSAVFLKVRSSFKSGLIAVVIIWLLNMIVFINIDSYDDLIILGFNLILLLIGGGYEKNIRNTHLSNAYCHSNRF